MASFSARISPLKKAFTDGEENQEKATNSDSSRQKTVNEGTANEGPTTTAGSVLSAARFRRKKLLTVKDEQPFEDSGRFSLSKKKSGGLRENGFWMSHLIVNNAL
jgi:hypothetical protein